MPTNHNQTDSSINEILQILKNFKVEGNRSKDNSQFSLFERSTNNPFQDLELNEWLLSTKREEGKEFQKPFLKNKMKNTTNVAKCTEDHCLRTSELIDRSNWNTNQSKRSIDKSKWSIDKSKESIQKWKQSIDKTKQSINHPNTSNQTLKATQKHPKFPKSITTAGSTIQCCRRATDYNYKSRSRSPLRDSINIFTKLHDEKKTLQQRRSKMQYDTRRSLEEKERRECTFSPHLRTTTLVHDSIDNEYFYNKNMEWLQRRQKDIKTKQCENNISKVVNLTFMPQINKCPKQRGSNKENTLTISKKKGVEDFLNRQTKAKQINAYIDARKKNPYSHVWNVKKGYFSHVN